MSFDPNDWFFRASYFCTAEDAALFAEICALKAGSRDAAARCCSSFVGFSGFPALLLTFGATVVVAGDFVPLVEYIKSQGCQVEVISFGRSSSARLRFAASGGA